MGTGSEAALPAIGNAIASMLGTAGAAAQATPGVIGGGMQGLGGAIQSTLGATGAGIQNVGGQIGGGANAFLKDPIGVGGDLATRYPLSYTTRTPGGGTQSYNNYPMYAEKHGLEPTLTPQGTQYSNPKAPSYDPITLLIYKQLDPVGYAKLFENKKETQTPPPAGFVEEK